MNRLDSADRIDSKLSSRRSHSFSILALLYLFVRFALTEHLDALGPFSSYIFEVACVFVAVLLLGRRTLTTLSLTKSVAYGSIISLIAGFGIYKIAGTLGIQVPFDLKSVENIFLLLLVAPTLEEAIFRFLLWQPLQLVAGRPVVALILTSLIFSYAHLHAIWFLPPEIHNFIIYQTAYTLLLGLACGFYVYRYSSLSSAMLIHFGFNLGFYFASLV